MTRCSFVCDTITVGITAESVAASVQSSIGDVEAGSIFATLQSAGMAGMASTTTFGIALLGSGVVEGVTVVADGVEDECGSDGMLGVLKSLQQLVMDKIDSLDISSWKNTGQHIVDKVRDIDWKKIGVSLEHLQGEAKEEYNKVKDYLSGKWHNFMH